MSVLRIGAKEVGDGRPTYVIAEIGLNHQGSVKLAKKLIDHAVKAGADAVKFQKRSLKDVYAAHTLKDSASEENATHFILGHIRKTELSDKQMKELCAYARSKDIEFLCSPWDEASLAFLATLDVPAYKIASADMFNLRLIGKVAALKKPLLISTGMSFPSEIEQVVDFLRKMNAEYILLHTNSTYPAPFKDINLRFLPIMRERFGCLVGYSGHERGVAVSSAAVALGACVVERHLTTDRALPGPDHRASLEPREFVELVRGIREVERSLGEAARVPSRGEYLNRETLSKSIVAAHDLKKGKVLEESDLALKSPGKGTSPLKIELFVGKKLIARDLKKDDYVLESDIGLRPQELYKPPKIKHTWGVVARPSDIDSLLHCKPDFVEIHLTGADVTSAKTSSKRYSLPFSVHGPDYDGDILLDLSSSDKRLREHSIRFFNKALAYARKLKKQFKSGDAPVPFIVHPGGFTLDKPRLSRATELNKNFANSLKRLDAKGFELLVENMPGCAWIFGGQWYESHFMDAEEIVAFSKKYGYGVVFDTSHAALYCNQYEKDIVEYARTILPVTKYLHISDGAGVNGEGLQISDGTVPWKKLLPVLMKEDIPFVPEIWQGHKFGGEGFLKAVKNLKDIEPRL